MRTVWCTSPRSNIWFHLDCFAFPIHYIENIQDPVKLVYPPCLFIRGSVLNILFMCTLPNIFLFLSSENCKEPCFAMATPTALVRTGNLPSCQELGGRHRRYTQRLPDLELPYSQFLHRFTCSTGNSAASPVGSRIYRSVHPLKPGLSSRVLDTEGHLLNTRNPSFPSIQFTQRPVPQLDSVEIPDAHILRLLILPLPSGCESRCPCLPRRLGLDRRWRKPGNHFECTKFSTTRFTPELFRVKDVMALQISLESRLLADIKANGHLNLTRGSREVQTSRFG